MKVKLYVPRADDSQIMDTTSFLYRTTDLKRNYRSKLNRFGEYKVVSRLDLDKKNSLDPIYTGISQALNKFLFMSTNDTVTTIITLKYDDGDTTIVFQKNKPHFFLNGEKDSKGIIIDNLSKILYRSCFENSSTKMDRYIRRLLLFPPNVMHSVENRTPYSFYSNDGSMVKQNVRIKTKIISDKECALEISDGVWASITIKDLNSFVNYHRHGHKRSEKWGVSPENLWKKLLSYEPSKSQIKLMYAFLEQNRTKSLVEKRAEELLAELETKFPSKIKVFKLGKRKQTIMLVRGQRCDWVLKESPSSSDTQKVNTHRFVENNDGEASSKGALIHPYNSTILGTLSGVCIDNVHKNSSLGDQFAARAMFLMNDVTSSSQINTMRLPDKEHRIPDVYWDNLDEIVTRGKL